MRITAVRRQKASCFVIIAALFVTLSLHGCEDNPVDSEGQDHVQAVGYVLEVEGEELVSYYLRQFEFNEAETLDNYRNLAPPGQTVPGDTIILQTIFREKHLDPETGKTPEITIHYLGGDREKIQMPEYYVDGERNPDGEWYLEFEYFQPGSRSVRLDPGDRPFEVIYDRTEATWKFHLQALQSGRADLRIVLFHLDHSDMAPIPLPIMIELKNYFLLNFMEAPH